MDKYFLFRSGEVNEYSDVFSNNGDNLSVLSISTTQVAYITAKKGSVVIVFNNAGIYEAFQGANREGLIKTRMEVECNVGEEYQLVKKITQFITTPAVNKRVLEFDAVGNGTTFKEASTTVVNPILPKQPVIMATQAISNDPAATDLTQTTTTTIAGITFTAPSLMPIVDFNEASLTSTFGQPVGSSHTWENAGTAGATYDINNDTGTPTHTRGGSASNGLRTDSVDIALGDDLIMAAELTVRDDYTMYMVIGAVAYGSFGNGIIDDGYVHIGFAEDTGLENTNSEFWVRHNTAANVLPAYMRTDNEDNETQSYTFPDPKLEEGVTGKEVGQTCYVFMLRRDKYNNLYLHNYTGAVVGYAEGKNGTVDFGSSGDLRFQNIGTGFRGELARFGIIESDIGGPEASRICKDLYDTYRWRY
jgi:hypothetical protein